MIMKHFGVLLASAALAVSGPASSFGGGHGGGGFHGGGFGGGHMGGFGGGHMGRFGGGNFGGPMFGGRSMAMGGFNRGFGFEHRFARFDHFGHFHHFHHFRNRFAFFPYFWGGGGDYGYPYANCGFWGDPYCGYGYGYGYPDYAYSYPDYGYAYDYGYPATGTSGYYAAAPLVTGRSVATGQQGSYCTISVKACELHHYGGGACSCRMPGGRAVAH
jgi:hypothetical protein